MFILINKELYHNNIHLGTIKPNYLSPFCQSKGIAPKSVFIILDNKFKLTASPDFLKSIRKFIRENANTSHAIIQWF
jgi:hypothetical protein